VFVACKTAGQDHGSLDVLEREDFGELVEVRIAMEHRNAAVFAAAAAIRASVAVRGDTRRCARPARRSRSFAASRRRIRCRIRTRRVLSERDVLGGASSGVQDLHTHDRRDPHRSLATAALIIPGSSGSERTATDAEVSAMTVPRLAGSSRLLSLTLIVSRCSVCLCVF